MYSRYEYIKFTTEDILCLLIYVYSIITSIGMAKILQREKACVLRKSGYSISRIAKTLSVSKSTASCWCRDISLTNSQMEKIAEESKHHATKSLLIAAEKQRTARKNNILLSAKKGRLTIGTLSKRDIYMIGLGLYWGEGYKNGSQEFGFTNSDPLMITFYIKWLHTQFNISLADLILRVSINEVHKERGDEIELYWSKLTNIPISQFTKTSYIKTKSKKVYPDTKEKPHHGTLRIKVRRGTTLRREVLGAISVLQ